MNLQIINSFLCIFNKKIQSFIKVTLVLKIKQVSLAISANSDNFIIHSYIIGIAVVFHLCAYNNFIAITM